MYGDTIPEKRDRLEIFKVQPGQPQRFLVRSERPFTFNAHFREKTLFCIGEGCVWCTHGLRKQWRGFIACVRPPKTPGALELSAEGFDAWEALAASQGLAGRVVAVSRRVPQSPARPQATCEEVDSSWPIVSALTLFDQICRLMSIPQRSHYSGEDGWAFAVTAVYRQMLDSAPFYGLERNSPPVGLKVIA